MRKLFILLALSMCLLIGAADASANGTTPHNYIASAIDSVCRIEIYQGDKRQGSGSGFVVAQSTKATRIVTARHVVENGDKFGIVLNGVRYFSSNFFKLKETDAAMIIVTPSIKGAKALLFNLSYSDKVTEANAMGFWGHSRLPGEKQKLTMTSGWVDRRVVDRFSAPDYKVIKGVIFGNVLVYPGYSGGPVVDNDMRVLGVNIILSSRHTIFVDGRYIYNSMNVLNQGKRVQVPWCRDYDIINTGMHSRVGVNPTDGISNKGKDKAPTEEISFLDIQKLIADDIRQNGKAGFPTQFLKLPSLGIRKLFNVNTIIGAGGKKYRISSVAIIANGLRKYGYETLHESNFKYIYLVQDGAEIMIELSDMPIDGQPAKQVNKMGAFFKNLTGRHFK